MRGIPARSALVASTVALAVALALGLPSAARAANLAPNPGFEDTSCGVTVCNWAGFNATILRVPTSPHTGASSMRVIATGSSTVVQALSDCFTVTPGTTYNLLVWYLASPPVTINQITYAATFYSQAACTGSSTAPAAAATNSPTIDGQWHILAGQTTAPAAQPFAAVSARIQLNFSCVRSDCKTSADPNALFDAVQYDDIVFDSSPLAVSVHSLTARRSHQNVLVRWRTGTEADLLGFHVYRSRGHSWQRLTRSLVVAKGSVTGASYRFVDRTARRGASYRYRIRAVERDGTASWFGPVSVTR